MGAGLSYVRAPELRINAGGDAACFSRLRGGSRRPTVSSEQGLEIPLERRTFDLLCYLLENRQRVVTKNELVERFGTRERSAMGHSRTPWPSSGGPSAKPRASTADRDQSRPRLPLPSARSTPGRAEPAAFDQAGAARSRALSRLGRAPGSLRRPDALLGGPPARLPRPGRIRECQRPRGRGRHRQDAHAHASWPNVLAGPGARAWFGAAYEGTATPPYWLWDPRFLEQAWEGSRTPGFRSPARPAARRAVASWCPSSSPGHATSPAPSPSRRAFVCSRR